MGRENQCCFYKITKKTCINLHFYRFMQKSSRIYRSLVKKLRQSAISLIITDLITCEFPDGLLIGKKKAAHRHWENQNPAVLRSSLFQSSAQVCEPAGGQRWKIWLISAQIFEKNAVLRRILCSYYYIYKHIMYFK